MSLTGTSPTARLSRRLPAVLAAAVAMAVSGCATDGQPADGGAGAAAHSPAGAAAPVTRPVSPDDRCDYLPSGCPGDRTREDEPVGVRLAQRDSAVLRSDVDATGPYSYTVEEYLTYVIQDVDRVWSEWFLANGFQEPHVGYQLVGPEDGTYISNCTNIGPVTADTANAYYCPADSLVGSDGVRYDGMVILPLHTFQRMWTGSVLDRPSAVAGDFAAAVVTAHEMGHHVRDEIATQLVAAGQSVAPPTGANEELIADCFAGVWMASAYYSGLLETGDFEEAVAALEAIGDETGSHGTAAQRRQALLVGYDGLAGETQPGDPMACIRTYWQ